MKPAKSQLIGWKYAWNGIRLVFSSQLNFRIQLMVSILVIGLGYYTRISVNEWITVCLSIALVMAFETVNTAIEFFVDMVQPEYHVVAGHIKDLSAGAVLIASIGAVCSGLFIFTPKILLLLDSL